jgi:hypothetical protein
LKSRLHQLDPKWTRAVATAFENRRGKSLFRTEMTYSVNQHFSYQTKIGTNGIMVNDDFGLLAHFRDSDVPSSIVPDNVLKASIKSVRVDVEFLYFVINVTNGFEKVKFV